MSIFKDLPTKKGPITKALEEAVALRKRLIADGTPVDQADQIVGQGLKSVLGNSRHEKWRFYCDRCHDTGWVEVEPEWGRLTLLYGPNPQAHSFVRKCEPCRYLEREREKRRSREGDDEDFTAPKPRGPRR